jgi:hypothetical protein
MFLSWIIFPSSGKKRKGRKTCVLGMLVELAPNLNQGGQQIGFSVFPRLPDDGGWTYLLECLDVGQRPKE